jgi:hypothetical protein
LLLLLLPVLLLLLHAVAGSVRGWSEHGCF